MAVSRKSPHVIADLGHDHRCRGFADAGDGAQEFDRGSKGARTGTLLQLTHRAFELLDLLQVEPQHESVMFSNVSAQRFDDLLSTCLEPTRRQVGQPFGVALAADKARQDRSPARPQDRADDLRSA